jgi:arylsulfatase
MYLQGRFAMDIGMKIRKVTLGRLAVCSLMVACVAVPSVAQTSQKPNIVVIMGDDIGWMQPSIYPSGLMVGEPHNIDRIGNEGAILLDYHTSPACIRCARA